jgi:hypothetical protein
MLLTGALYLVPGEVAEPAGAGLPSGGEAAMERVMKGLAFAALALTVLAPLLVSVDSGWAKGSMKAWLLVGTVLWFVTAPWALKGELAMRGKRSARPGGSPWPRA